METDVNPINYSMHQINHDQKNDSQKNDSQINEINENVGVAPHQVFIKTEPQMLDRDLNEQMTKQYSPYDGAATYGQNANYNYNQTRLPFSQSTDIPISMDMVSGNNSLDQLNDIDIKPQFDPNAYFPQYFPGQTPPEVKLSHIGTNKAFPCDVCHKVFNQKYNLQRHQLLHSKERKFNCDVCAKTFVEKYQLKQHLLTHSAKKPYACSVCNKEFVQKYMLRNHMMTHTDNKPFACACGLRFRQIGALNRHRSGNFTKKTFQCDLCMKIFKQKAHLIRHINFHSGQKQFSCTICNKQFSQQSNLNTHKLIHSFEKRFTCESCDKSFRQAHHLSRHKKRHIKCGEVVKVTIEVEEMKTIDNPNAVFIKSEPQDIPSEYNEKSEHDITEPKTDDQSKALEHNETNETPQKKTQGCPFAETKIELPKEYLEKKEKKYYPCEVCRKVFYKPFHLLRHKVIHSGVRPFKCDTCDKSFFLNYHLQNHKTTHTGVKPFVCNVCNTRFNRKSALARHMQLHIDKNRFPCDFCNRTFSTEPFLIKHQNRLCKKKSEYKKMIMRETKPVGYEKGKSFNPETQEPPELMKIEIEETSSNTKLKSPAYDQRITQSDDESKIHDQTYLDQQKSISQRKYIISEEVPFHICDHCDRYFKKKSWLILHLETKKCMETRLIPCKRCSKLFTESDLPIHVSSHTQDKPLACDVCAMTFSENNNLVKHKLIHQKQELYQRDVCSSTFITKPYLDKHKLEHDTHPYSCNLCPKTFAQSSDLAEHKLIHSEGKPLHECKICQKLFRKGDLTRHERTHSGKKPYKCDICEKAFALKGNLMAHQIVHTGMKYHTCNICRMTFNTYHHLTKHRKEHGIVPQNMFGGHSPVPTGEIYHSSAGDITHSSAIPSGEIRHSHAIPMGEHRSAVEPTEKSTSIHSATKTSEQVFEKTKDEAESIVIKVEPLDIPVTYEDDNESSQSTELIVPELTNPVEDPKDCSQTENDNNEQRYKFFCDRCQSGFNYRQSLIKHLTAKNKCAEAGRTKCTICSKIVVKNYLKQHLRMHTGEKPYSCDICFKSFSRGSHLIDHKFIHTEERPFICEVCQRSFTQRAHLLRHKLVHTGEKRFPCDVCNKSFTRSTYLVEHKRIHSGEKPFSCNICHKTFHRSCSLAQHRLIHREHEPFKCNICLKGFSQKIHLQTHLLRHDEANRFQCDFCEKSFSKNSNLHRHMKSHKKLNPLNLIKAKLESQTIESESQARESNLTSQTDTNANTNQQEIFDTNIIIKVEPKDLMFDDGIIKQEPIDQTDVHDNLECENETSQLKQESNLEKNANISDDERNRNIDYIVPELSLESTVDDDTASHSLSRQKNNPEYNKTLENYRRLLLNMDEALKSSQAQSSTAYEEDVEKFECDRCTRQFKYKHSLFMHIQANKCLAKGKPLKTTLPQGENVTDFQCDICNKYFARKKSLNRHKATHTGIKAYSCDVCNSSFTQKSSLIRHAVVHSGEKTFSCHVCNKSFARSSTLNKHKLIHSNIRRYPCDQCDKTFMQRSHMQKHQMTHTGEREFNCDFCDMSFAQKSALMRHKTCHKNEKRYMCPVCHKLFTRKTHLIEHEKTHTGEKPYSCDRCSMQFTFKSGYRRHKKLVHDEDLVTNHEDESINENKSISLDEKLIPNTEAQPEKIHTHSQEENVCSKIKEKTPPKIERN